MRSKWGCDGTSGFNQYKQKFENPDNSDQSLFLQCIVPLVLTTDCNEKITLWENPRPATTNFCRPIKFEYTKETKEKVRETFKEMKSQLNHLQVTHLTIDNISYKVRHQIISTMLDGKAVQYITETSSPSVCVICGSSPKEMNNLQNFISKPENVQNFEYGLASLHAWIRSMECILHIAYRLPFQKWSATLTDDNKVLQKTKKYIQLEIREKLGLIVDVPKQGSGSSDDGNTGRRFFENYGKVSEITGINEDLLFRLYVILQVIASGRAIDFEKFHSYAIDTAELYVQNYKWYYMPA